MNILHGSHDTGSTPAHGLTSTTRMSPERLLQTLAQQGLLPDAGEPAGSGQRAATASPDRPWYIALLLGISGWVAGLFLLVFVALVFQPTSPGAAAGCGAVLLLTAWGLYQADRNGAFLTQLALALSMAGQCLLLYAMVEDMQGVAQVAATAFVLQAAMVLVMPNRMHRTLSTVFALTAWAVALQNGLLGKSGTGGGLIDAALSPSDSLLGWLATWLPPGIALWVLIRNEANWMARGWQALVRPVMSGLIVALAVVTFASRPTDSYPGFFGGDPTGTGWLALWPLLAALAALGGLAAAFALRSRALMGVCIAAALLHVSQFYYELGTSLLLKALIMAVMGVAMWLTARALSSKLPASAASSPTRPLAPSAVQPASAAWRFLPVHGIALLGTVAVLGAINFSIVGKERIKADGDVVYLALAPVDPRSLIQGDYMTLRFGLAQALSEQRFREESAAGNGAQRLREGETAWAEVSVDDQRIGTLATARGAPGTMKLRYRIRNGDIWLGTNAYFFEEGSGGHFQAARFGEFRVDRHSGEAVLVGLRDESLTLMVKPPPARFGGGGGGGGSFSFD